MFANDSAQNSTIKNIFSSLIREILIFSSFLEQKKHKKHPMSWTETFKGLENVTNRFSAKFCYKNSFSGPFVFLFFNTMWITMNEYFKGIGDVTNRSGPVSFARIPIFRSIRAFSSLLEAHARITDTFRCC